MENVILKNIFYVYEWHNRDTGEVFYVGKGSGYRYKSTKNRSPYFRRYYDKYNCDVRKVYENLSEPDSFKKEVELIKHYKSLNLAKCNFTVGGEGNKIEFPSSSAKKLYYDMRRMYREDKMGLDEYEQKILYDLMECYGINYSGELLLLPKEEFAYIAYQYDFDVEDEKDNQCGIKMFNEIMLESGYKSMDEFWDSTI